MTKRFIDRLYEMDRREEVLGNRALRARIAKAFYYLIVRSQRAEFWTEPWLED